MATRSAEHVVISWIKGLHRRRPKPRRLEPSFHCSTPAMNGGKLPEEREGKSSQNSQPSDDYDYLELPKWIKDSPAKKE